MDFIIKVAKTRLYSKRSTCSMGMRRRRAASIIWARKVNKNATIDMNCTNINHQGVIHSLISLYSVPHIGAQPSNIRSYWFLGYLNLSKQNSQSPMLRKGDWVSDQDESQYGEEKLMRKKTAPTNPVMQA